MARIYLGLGSNLGDKKENIQRALNEIAERIGEVISVSAFYETAPWGFESENSFINIAAAVDTGLQPRKVMEAGQDIEKLMGRVPRSMEAGYADRIIDIDLLLYDDLIIDQEDLIIPHPLMTDRAFVMEPMMDIAPEVIHPVFNMKLKELSDLPGKPAT